jgi:hypothetical protein
MRKRKSATLANMLNKCHVRAVDAARVSATIAAEVAHAETFAREFQHVYAIEMADALRSADLA